MARQPKRVAHAMRCCVDVGYPIPKPLFKAWNKAARLPDNRVAPKPGPLDQDITDQQRHAAQAVAMFRMFELSDRFELNDRGVPIVRSKPTPRKRLIGQFLDRYNSLYGNTSRNLSDRQFSDALRRYETSPDEWNAALVDTSLPLEQAQAELSFALFPNEWKPVTSPTGSKKKAEQSARSISRK